MKILIPLVGTFSKEGGWRVLSELANHWLLLGHEVVFLSHKKYKDPYFPTNAAIIFYDNNGDLSNYGNKDYESPSGGPFILRRLLKKVLNKMEADIVLATQHFTVEPISRSNIKAKKYYYVQAYEPEFYDKGPLRYQIYKRIAKNSYKKNLKIIVNAPMYKNYMEIKSDRVIYPGLNFDIFYPEEKKRSSEILILGSIGRTEVFKGTAYILRAFEKLRGELGEFVELHLAFGDPLWSNIEGVKMHYPKGDMELADYYRSLDCYICAQYIQLEAVHYPVIESMACGIPLITTGYYPSDEHNAWLIDAKNHTDIVVKVKEFISNPERATIKKNNALEAIKEFEWNLVAEKMISYFNE